ncbi:MAG: rod shape-determining protein MreB [bacterium JZ-2024 1]
MWRWMENFFTVDLGVDLGTVNTLVYVRGEGIVLRAPSVVAVHRETGQVLAVGEEARQMLGKTPETIIAERPLRGGVIADFDKAELMLRHFLGEVLQKKGFFRRRPRAVIGVPSGITQVEKRAVIDAAFKSGCREVELITEPMAAAIGAKLPINEPVGNMVVDIGGGTSEVAVISLGGIVHQESIRVAGDAMDEAVQSWIRMNKQLDISLKTAEAIKIQLGSAHPTGVEEKTMQVRGFDIIRRLPGTIEVSSREIREALKGAVNQIVQLIRRSLEQTPPDLCEDIVRQGIVLTGGGALLAGLDTKIKEETGIHTYVDEDPLTTVVRGTGIYVEYKYSNKKFSARF